MVEVAGIEPASFGAEPGLLRAQPACAFLGPSSQTGKLLTGPVAVRFPARSRDRTEQLSLLADARHRAEGTPGLTACSRYLGSEGVGALIGIGAYWCAGPGFRDHPSHPRPASPGSTSEVETIHPLCSCAPILTREAIEILPACDVTADRARGKGRAMTTSDTQPHHRRPLPPGPVHRPGRHGHRLAGPRRAARPRGRDQGGPFPARAGQAGDGRPPRAHDARGPRHRTAEPPQRHHDVRRRRGGRSALDRHGAAGDPEPERAAAGRRTAAAAPRRRDRPRRAERPGDLPRPGHRAPRRQAQQHPDHRRRSTGADRLRHRHDDRRPGADLDRRRPRLPRLHVAGTRPRQGVRAGERPLVPGRDAVLRGRGAAAVRVGQRPRHPDRRHLRPGHAAVGGRTARSRRRRPAAQGPSGAGRVPRDPRAAHSGGGRPLGRRRGHRRRRRSRWTGRGGPRRCRPPASANRSGTPRRRPRRRRRGTTSPSRAVAPCSWPPWSWRCS